MKSKDDKSQGVTLHYTKRYTRPYIKARDLINSPEFQEILRNAARASGLDEAKSTDSSTNSRMTK